MSVNLSDLEFRLFKAYIGEKCGIDIGWEKAYLIETRLAHLLSESKLNSFAELYSRITTSGDIELSEKIIDSITTNETLWFRDKTPWTILQKIYLPQFVKMIRSGEKKKIRIWSSASSTGQEAYSTAICIDNYLQRNLISDVTLSNFEIIGTDISNACIELAVSGRYDNITIMRGLDKEIKDSCFKNMNTYWEINDKYKKAVKFLQFNLQKSFFILGSFDVIFCRYVLIYFSDEFKVDVIRRARNALTDGGVMFLGAYETYDVLRDYFTCETLENGCYYIKK